MQPFGIAVVSLLLFVSPVLPAMPPAPTGPYQSLEDELVRREPLPVPALPDRAVQPADACEDGPSPHVSKPFGAAGHGQWDWGVPAMQQFPVYGDAAFPDGTPHSKRHCNPHSRPWGKLWWQ